jgi:hypothetical protein
MNALATGLYKIDDSDGKNGQDSKRSLATWRFAPLYQLSLRAITPVYFEFY